MSDQNDKKYTAVEAARLILAKAEELYKNSSLAKKYEGFKAVEASAAKSGASDPAAVAAAVGRKKYGKEAFQHAAAAGKKMKKSDENPDEKEDAKLGEEVERDVEQHEAENHEAEEKEAQHEKGHLKLAKFMGRMEHKRGMKAKEMDKAETGHEKGVHPQASGKDKYLGQSPSGKHVRDQSPGDSSQQDVKPLHQKVLGEMKNIKPKLPG